MASGARGAGRTTDGRARSARGRFRAKEVSIVTSSSSSDGAIRFVSSCGNSVFVTALGDASDATAGEHTGRFGPAAYPLAADEPRRHAADGDDDEEVKRKDTGKERKGKKEEAGAEGKEYAREEEPVEEEEQDGV